MLQLVSESHTKADHSRSKARWLWTKLKTKSSWFFLPVALVILFFILSQSSEATDAQRFFKQLIWLFIIVSSLVWIYPKAEDDDDDHAHFIPSKDFSWREKLALKFHQFRFQWFWILVGFAIVVCCNLGTVHKVAEPHGELPGDLPHWYTTIVIISEKLGEAAFIAAFVSWIFDVGYHRTMFGKHVERIRELIEEEFGYLNFLQSKKYQSFRSARDRIIVVSDYWAIDPDWWENWDIKWTETKLYKALFEKLRTKVTSFDSSGNVSSDFRIIFAGNVPSPHLHEAASIKGNSEILFTPPEFRALLGVMWHLIVAHNIRSEVKKIIEKKFVAAGEGGLEKYNLPDGRDGQYTGKRILKIPLKVHATSAPFMTTIVDDKVWMVIPDQKRPGDMFYAKGFDLARHSSISGDLESRENRRINAQLADDHLEILARYLRHSHSAREHVQSILLLCLQLSKNKNKISPNAETSLIDVDRDKISARLPLKEAEGFWNDSKNLLGFYHWIAWEQQQKTKNPKKALVFSSEDELMKAAEKIITDFFTVLPGAGIFIGHDWDDYDAFKNELKFSDLIKDNF